MKSLCVCLLMIVAWQSRAQSEKLNHQVIITSSHFTLVGTTNLNTFSCSLVQEFPTLAMPVTSTNGEYHISFSGLELTYPIKEFDCGLEAMSQDLRNTLNAKNFPNLVLKINDIFIKRKPQEIENLDVSAEVTITLAGVSNDITIKEGTVINRSEEALTLTGKTDISMESFKLNPPTKFFGMVKVNSELQVAFELNMKVNTEN
ncbi:MAG: YceI family protein [Cyclobacteriaceae bacterium]